MTEEDHESRAYEVIDFIHLFVRERGREPTESELVSNSWPMDVDIRDKNLRDLENGGYIQKGRAPDDLEGEYQYGLTGKGAEFLRNAKLRETLEKSIEQEKLSSAAETLFTLTILTSAWIQSSIALSSNLPKTRLINGLPFS